MSRLEFSDLKKGTIIVWGREPHEILWSNFLRMQQRKPVMQVKMRNLVTGKVVEYSFKSGERVAGADIEKKKAQYLYADKFGAHFLDQENYETIVIPQAISGEKLKYLKEGEEATLEFFEGKPMTIALPIKINLKVVNTPPGIKGDTAAGGTKPATLETGIVVNVPLFVKEEDIVRINTETGEYVERAN